MAYKITWVSFFKILLLLLLVAGIVIVCFALPVEKMLKDFLVWVDQDLGPWGSSSASCGIYSFNDIGSSIFSTYVVLMVYVTRVAKAALDKALAETEGVDGDIPSPESPITAHD